MGVWPLSSLTAQHGGFCSPGSVNLLGGHGGADPLPLGWRLTLGLEGGQTAATIGLSRSVALYHHSNTLNQIR